MQRTTTATAMDVVDDYLAAVSQRGRVAMPPAGFQPDWDDQPSRHTPHIGADRIALPHQPSTMPATVDRLAAGDRPVSRAWELPDIGWVLRSVYSPQDRRLRITWNQDTRVRELYPEAIWGRGAASGGGMYPLEVYLVTDGALAGLAPGVYHYSTAHHALEPLSIGDEVSTIAEAVGSDAGTFLVVTARFWKNSFKYNSFAYHVVTQDTGAFMYAAGLLARSIGRPFSPRLRFDAVSVDRVLAVTDGAETALAVVPLLAASPRAIRLAVRRTEVRAFERSRRTLQFEMVDAVHRAVTSHPAAAPAAADELDTGRPDVGPGSDGLIVRLPEPTALPGEDPSSVLRRRRSSFGAFSSTAPIGQDQVHRILVAAAEATASALPNERVRPVLSLFATRIDNLEPGAYRFDGEIGGLRLLSPDDRIDRFLQRNYFLSNYNLDTASGVIAVGLDWTAIRAQDGAVGYRIANAVAAAVGQSVNITATAIGLGSGIVLGFDNISFDELIDDGTKTFLFVIIGRDRDGGAHYRFDIA